MNEIAQTQTFNNESNQKKTRQTGLEILRIISMFLIGCVHVLNYGGMLKNATGDNAVLWMKLVYAFFTTSVNIFILITGYFMVKSKPKFKKLIHLWFQVLAYSLITYLAIVLIYNEPFKIKDLFLVCIPIVNKRFWFITTYFVLFLIIPFLNILINNLSKKQANILMIGILIFVYLTTRFGIRTIASLNNGYSLLWFIILYFTGAYLRLYPLKVKKIFVVLTYFIAIVGIWLFFMYPPKSEWSFFYSNTPDYNAPLVFIASVCIFLIFKDINFKNKFINSVVGFVSSCTFGIYLFQESYIKYYLYYDWLNIKRFYTSVWPAWFKVLCLGAVIFLLGFIVEVIRKIIVKVGKIIVNKVKKIKNK